MKKSLLSGILVGIGVIINTMSGNKYIGAMLFSLALLSIIECKLKLYTGMIGFFKFSTNLSELLFVLAFNLLGINLLFIFLMIVGNENILYSLKCIGEIKFEQSIFQLFLFSFLCGVLMLIAVYCKKTIITIFCIMTFILSGFEHCIADYPYFLMNFTPINLVKFIFIIFGNSIGSITAHKLISNKERNNDGL